MSFRIASIQARIVDHPLHESRIVISPAGRHDTSRFLIVTVRDVDGVVGYGEAATTPLWSGETAETAQLMVNEVFAPLVIGHTFEHPREALAIMDAAAYANSFAKSAIDTALWDVWARAQNVAASSLFGDRAPAEWIPTRASVGCYDVPTSVRIATEFWESGIRTLKFKIGMPGIDDAARLRAVREKLGDEPIFTVDANGAYHTLEAAVTAIEALLPYNLFLVEQPSPRERIALLAQIKARVDVPIMADECIFTSEDLREALECDACDLVSLYPGKNGGVTHTIEMAQMAAAAGKSCAIGSNLETDLGQAAMASVAASLSAFPVAEIPCDLPAAIFYRQSSLKEPLVLQNGRVKVPTGPGFGVEPLDC